MKIVIAFLLVFQLSFSTASYAQTSNDGNDGVTLQYPVLRKVELGSVSVPDGGLVRHSQAARKIHISPSIDFLANVAGHAKSASVQRFGFFDALMSGILSKELKLTGQQKELLADKANQILESHERMQKESVEELLDNFTTKQIEKLNAILGSDFEKEVLPNSRSLLRELHKRMPFKK